jgi:hypothetical protein
VALPRLPGYIGLRPRLHQSPSLTSERKRDESSPATRSLAAAAGAVLHRSLGYAAAPQIPGAVPESLIQSARFPAGFIWGTATASYQVEGA